VTPYVSPSPAPNLGLLFLTALLLCLLIYLAYAIPFAGVLRKTGRGGGAAYVPIYNSLTLLDVVGRPWWWLLLCCIPFASLVFMIIVLRDLARSFNKGAAFTVGLIFLPWLFLMILWLDDSIYRGPVASSERMTTYISCDVVAVRRSFVLPTIPIKVYRAIIAAGIVVALLVAIINHGLPVVICCLLGVGVLGVFLVLG
jgi:uncharacterized protein DUF5684